MEHLRRGNLCIAVDENVAPTLPTYVTTLSFPPTPRASPRPRHLNALMSIRVHTPLHLRFLALHLSAVIQRFFRFEPCLLH